MKIRNNDYAKNARKRILRSMNEQELNSLEHRCKEAMRKKRESRVLRTQLKMADYVEFEEVK